MRVMISAAASPAAISMLTHLRDLGHHVTGMDADALAAPVGEAFCDTFHLCPLAGSPDYVPFLCERLAETDLFFPFIDEELVAIVENWESIPPQLAARIAMSPPEVVRTCVDKRLFQQACEQAGLPIAPQISFPPAIFKPRIGRGGRGVMVLDELPLLEAVRHRDGVIQQLIQGDEYTVDAIYDKEGRLLATSPRLRLRKAGVSTLGEVVGHDSNIHALALELGRVFQLRYAINFQLIRDEHGKDWLIELNPRLAGSSLFSAMAGCDPFAATIAIFSGQTWHGEPRALRVWRYWHEWTV